VISGGGARGFAHIGGIRALRKAGIQIDRIGGTSMGSIIAAMVAMGWDYETMLEHASLFNYKPDYTFPSVSLTAGGNVTKALRDGLGTSRIEDLHLTFFCISTDLRSSDQKVHRTGPLWKYVRASVSIPGLFPPIVENGSIPVDGGIINNMPVDVMKSSDDIGRVIAFDVSRSAALQGAISIDGTLSGWKVLTQRCNPFKKETTNVPTLTDTLIQASLTKSAESIRRTKRSADFYIQFPVQQYGLLAFNQIADIAEVGYVCAKAKIEEWRDCDSCDLPISH
jgi:predicted acylesterase/phospholipase RssA